MVGILAQVDDIFSWAPRGGKLIGTGWGMRIQGHGYLNILCRCNIRRSAREQREHGFLLDQHYSVTSHQGSIHFIIRISLSMCVNRVCVILSCFIVSLKRKHTQTQTTSHQPPPEGPAIMLKSAKSSLPFYGQYTTSASATEAPRVPVAL